MDDAALFPIFAISLVVFVVTAVMVKRSDPRSLPDWLQLLIFPGYYAAGFIALSTGAILLGSLLKP